jgi:hypothetical protein
LSLGSNRHTKSKNSGQDDSRHFSLRTKCDLQGSKLNRIAIRSLAGKYVLLTSEAGRSGLHLLPRPLPSLAPSGPLFAVAGGPATLDAEGQASGRRTNGVGRKVSGHHRAWSRPLSTDLADPALPSPNLAAHFRNSPNSDWDVRLVVEGIRLNCDPASPFITYPRSVRVVPLTSACVVWRTI